MKLPTITIPSWNQISGLKHAFFTREGGVSKGLYNSLNCGLGAKDDISHVTENRQRCVATLTNHTAHLQTLYQIHSAIVVDADSHNTTTEERPQGDALVTSNHSLAIGVLAADCAPVLFVDPHARIIGAAHAGWRGASGGILEATIAAMLKKGAQLNNIKAGIGPCIGENSYEVSNDFQDNLSYISPWCSPFFKHAARQGHLLFNLSGYIQQRLQLAGLSDIHTTNQDTLSNPLRFFSYRRSCLNNESDYGRMLSAIMWENG
ncbi:MAG: peptidoglycan editing factor PgeF [Alphaproteobacteria bacterium]